MEREEVCSYLRDYLAFHRLPQDILVQERDSDQGPSSHREVEEYLSLLSTMSHAHKDRISITNDTNSTYSSRKESASNMAPAPTTFNLTDRDTQVFYFKYFRQFWASGPAAAVAVVAGSPFENVKTRMQSRHFTSAFSAAKFVYQYEGVRGFWRGTLAPLTSLTFSRTLGFIAYRKAKYAIDRVIERTTGDSPLEWVNTTGTYPNLSTLVCFSTAGMVSGAALTPILSEYNGRLREVTC